MKCAQCVAEGRKSEVYPGMSWSTLMYFAPYYDEDGTYHNHDRSTTTTDFRCSNGHQWQEQSGSRCPNCDWGKTTEASDGRTS